MTGRDSPPTNNNLGPLEDTGTTAIGVAISGGSIGLLGLEPVMSNTATTSPSAECTSFGMKLV